MCRFNKTILKETIILINKNQDKKIIRGKLSLMKELEKNFNGAFFVGKDITYDWYKHKRLIHGNCYIIQDKKNDISFSIFSNLANPNCKGLLITRKKPSNINSILQNTNIEISILSKEKFKNYKNVSDLDSLNPP